MEDTALERAKKLLGYAIISAIMGLAVYGAYVLGDKITESFE